MSTYFETPEEAATGMKLSIADFIEEWLEKHDIYDSDKINVIAPAIQRAGWPFFHDELVLYFENVEDYEIDDNEGVTVLDGEEEEDWMPQD
jgi:hypothetical protein